MMESLLGGTSSTGSPAAAAAGPSVLSVAKLVVMGGVMYAARSWNNEDAQFVHQLRVAYAAVHVLIVAIVTYIFYLTNVQMTATAATATAANSTSTSRDKGTATLPPEQQVIYVPAPAQVRSQKVQYIYVWRAAAMIEKFVL
jgi:hypothetical protein